MKTAVYQALVRRPGARLVGAAVGGIGHAKVPYIHSVPSVRFAIRRIRYKGRILPWREIDNRAPLVGDLRIEECRDDELHRYVRTAALHDPMVIVTRDIPRLYDVRIVSMSPQAFTLTGFERIEGAEYAQSWLVSPVTPEVSGGRSRRVVPP